MVNVTRNRYTPEEERHYIGLVQMVNLAKARGVPVNLESESSVLAAKQQLRKLLLADYAEKKLLTAEARREREIQEYKDRYQDQPVPMYLQEKDFHIEDFLTEAEIDFITDLKLIPKNPCEPNPLVEYHRFHEK